jgi:ElaB/YqjD/DUF883 family membrane-anchored ribosome-binding protein
MTTTKQAIGDAGESIADAARGSVEGAKKFGDAAAEQIRAHPLAAFGIAFAAGALISRVLRGR